jgi:hypothetical protein
MITPLLRRCASSTGSRVNQPPACVPVWVAFDSSALVDLEHPQSRRSNGRAWDQTAERRVAGTRRTFGTVLRSPKTKTKRQVLAVKQLVWETPSTFKNRQQAHSEAATRHNLAHLLRRSHPRRSLQQAYGSATPPSAVLPRQPPTPARQPRARGTLDLCQQVPALRRSQHNLVVTPPARLGATALAAMLHSRMSPL